MSLKDFFDDTPASGFVGEMTPSAAVHQMKSSLILLGMGALVLGYMWASKLETFALRSTVSAAEVPAGRSYAVQSLLQQSKNEMLFGKLDYSIRPKLTESPNEYRRGLGQAAQN